MIGEFEGSNPNITIAEPCVQLGDYSKFKSVYLTLPGFSFTDEDDFADQDIWIAAIEAGNIFPFHNIKESLDNSDDIILNPSKNNRPSVIADGKYKFNLHFSNDIEFFKKAAEYSEQDLKVIFHDVNDNIIAVGNDDGSVEGFESDLIKFKKLRFGTSEIPSWTQLFIQLEDPRQIFDVVVTTIEFSLEGIALVEAYDFEQISANEMTFYVRDVLYEQDINGLVEGNFSIVDNISGSLSLSTFEARGNGQYYIQISGTYYNGTLTIGGCQYFGDGDYLFMVGVMTVHIVNNYRNGTQSHIHVKVVDDVGAPVTTLLSSHFSIEDDTNGTIVVNGKCAGFINTGGFYCIYTNSGTAFTSGIITVDNGTIQTSVSYDITGYDYWNECIVPGVGTTTSFFDEVANGAFTSVSSVIVSNGYRIYHTGGGSSSHWEIYLVAPDMGAGTYTVTFEIESYTSGTLTLSNGATNQNYTNAGSKTFNYTAAANGVCHFDVSGVADMIISNIRIIKT